MSHIVNDQIRFKVDNDIQISNSNYYICMLKDGAIQCEKLGYYSSNYTLRVPELKNPIDVSVSSRTVCAIDDTGIVCSGDSDLQDFAPKTLKNPRGISSSGDRACAIDDLGISCWGNLAGRHAKGRYGPGGRIFKPLINPTHVNINGREFCAIDETGLKCWEFELGSLEYNTQKIETPELVNPSSVAIIDFFAICAIDRTGLNCWPTYLGKLKPADTTWFKKNFREHIPDLVNPTHVIGNGFSLDNSACALDSQGVHCWSDKGPYKTIPTLKNPSALSGSARRPCVVDDGQVICWLNYHEESEFFPL